MIYIEALLLTIMIVTCIYSSLTDLRNGIILNKVLISAALLSIVLDLFYYGLYANEYFKVYILNVLVITFISIAFYGFNFWAAGDCKLLILIVLSFPGRLYKGNTSQEVFPSIYILIFGFSIAFLYVICESVILGIKSKDILKIHKLKLNVKEFIKQYYICSAFIISINYLLHMFAAEFYQNNQSVVLLFEFLICLCICKISSRFSKSLIVSATVLMIILLIHNGIFNFNIKNFGYLFLILLIKTFADKYNYKSVPIEKVKKGMIMSYSTIMLFTISKIKGLPSTTTEDMRSRISQEDVESIRRWKLSKYGNNEILIVRKLPFAIFLSLGVLSFLVLKVRLLW